MKVYKYIHPSEIEKYNGWDIEQVVRNDKGEDMLIISRIKISCY